VPDHADAPLPHDVPSLHALVRELWARDARKDDRIKQLLRQAYGQKSERHRPPSGVSQMAQAHGRGGRHPLPRHLRTRVVVVDLPASHKKGLKVIHREIREHLEYSPASIHKVRYIIPVYAHPQKLHPPRKAHVPPRVIPRASVGPRLLARLLVAKYVDHLPLNRQSAIFGRDGVKLARQKLCHWVQQCAHLLWTVFRQLVARLQRARYFQVDETPVAIRLRELRGKMKRGYMWVFLDPVGQTVVFDCRLTRAQRAAESMIPRRRAGEMQSDAYKVYQRVAATRPFLTLFLCQAHARRKVKEAYDDGERHAAVIDTLADYHALYEIEERGKKLSPEERAKLRGKECPPIFKRMKARYEAALDARPLRRGFRRAAKYALKHWWELIRYAAPGYGHVMIDTNAVERAIKPVKLGLRNYGCFGTPEAGSLAAVVFSLAATCGLLGVNPEAYFNWVLPRLAEGTNQSTTQGLLPHDYAAMLTAHRAKK
jgi:transposase